VVASEEGNLLAIIRVFVTLSEVDAKWQVHREVRRRLGSRSRWYSGDVHRC